MSVSDDRQTEKRQRGFYFNGVAKKRDGEKIQALDYEEPEQGVIEYRERALQNAQILLQAVENSKQELSNLDDAMNDNDTQLKVTKEDITKTLPMLLAPTGPTALPSDDDLPSSSSNDQRSNLKAEFEKLKQEHSQAVQRANALEKEFSDKKTELEGRITELIQALESSTAQLKHQQEEKQSEITVLERNMNVYETTLESQKQELQTQKENVRKLSEDLQQKQSLHDSLTEKFAQLVQKANKTNQLNTQNIAKLQEKETELESSKRTYEITLASLKTQLNNQTARSDGRIRAAGEELQKLRDQTNTEMADQRKNFEEKQREFQIQKQQLEQNLEVEKNKYNEAVEELRRNTDVNNASLNEEISSLRKQTAIDQNLQKNLTSDLERMQAQISKQEDDLDREQRLLRSTQEELLKIQNDVLNITSDKEKSERDLAKQIELYDSLQRKQERRKATNRRLKEELKMLRENPKQFVEKNKNNERRYERDSSDDDDEEEEERRRKRLPRRQQLMPSALSQDVNPLLYTPPPIVSLQPQQPPVTVNVNTHYPSLSQLRDDGDDERPPSQQRVISTSSWIRKSDGKILPQSETIDIQSFTPKIPEQAKRWQDTLNNIARNSDIGNPHRVYEAVERLLKTNHPDESEFYHDFYLLVRTVEGKAGKKRGQFWVAETEDLKHLANNIIEAATESITVVPLKEAGFFPLSKADLSNGISYELQQFKEKPRVEPPKPPMNQPQIPTPSSSSLSSPSSLSSSYISEPSSSRQGPESRSLISNDIQSEQPRRYAWNASRKRTPHAPRFPLPTPKQLNEGLPELPQGRRPRVLPGGYHDTIETIHQQELTKKQQEARRQGSGWTAEERDIAALNQSRYQNRYPNAPLRGIDQRLAEYGLRDRLDPSLVLFDNENALVITYNFWDFIQQRILGNINKAQPNYVVEFQEGSDYSWTNVVQGTDFNDIAHYLADHLWENLQVRHIGGPLTRKPSMLSVKKYLDNQAISRITDELVQIDQEYVQPWQDRIFSMLQTAVDSSFFAAFRESMNDLNLKFEIGETKFKDALKNMFFASLVAAHYQKTIVDTSVSSTGYRIANTNSNVTNAIDAARESMGLSKITTGFDFVNTSFVPSFISSLPQPNRRQITRNRRNASTLIGTQSILGFDAI